MSEFTLMLTDFLRTGQMGPLRHSLTRQEVKDILGDPTEWSISHKREKMAQAFIWCYGSLAVNFNVYSRVCRISLDMFEDHPWSLPPQISLITDLSLHDISKERFQEYLEANDLAYDIDDSWAQYFGRHFVIHDCTSVVFDGEDERLTLISTLMMMSV